MSASIYEPHVERRERSRWREGFATQGGEFYERQVSSGRFLFKEVKVEDVSGHRRAIASHLSRLIDEEESFTIKEWEEIIKSMEDFQEGRHKSFTDVEDLIAYLHSNEE